MQEAREGGSYESRAAGSGQSSAAPPPATQSSYRAGSNVADSSTYNLNFLTQPSAMLLNLKPNQDGQVVIGRHQLGIGTLVRIVAVDGDHLAVRLFGLPCDVPKFSDLRLIDMALDPSRHYTEQKEVSPIVAQETFTIKDITTSSIELYENISKVFGLLMTLTGNRTLEEFRFVLRWNGMSFEEKCEKYSEKACHELAFFIYKKDRPFFEAVVRPYLENKREKTFLDHWLLDYNLNTYMEPWRFQRLNIAEKLLLAERLPEEQWKAIEKTVRDDFERRPVEVEQWNSIFDTAIKGQSLDTEDALGYGEEKERQQQQQKQQLQERRKEKMESKAAPSPMRPVCTPN